MVEDKCFPVDLVILEFINFIVILWMDWLSANYAILDRKNKLISSLLKRLDISSKRGDLHNVSQQDAPKRM